MEKSKQKDLEILELIKNKNEKDTLKSIVKQNRDHIAEEYKKLLDKVYLKMQSQNMEIDSIKQAFKQYDEICKQRQKNQANINEMGRLGKKNNLLDKDNGLLLKQINR